MSFRDFLEEYRGIVQIVAVAFMVIILFFLCLGFSRTIRPSSSSNSSSGTVLKDDTQESQGDVSVVLPGEVTDPQVAAAETPAAPAETTAPETSAPATFEVDGVTYNAVNETVVTTARVNARTSPDTSSEDNIIKTMALGTEVTRTGISADGEWSQITLDGQTAYCSSSFVAAPGSN